MPLPASGKTPFINANARHAVITKMKVFIFSIVANVSGKYVCVLVFSFLTVVSRLTKIVLTKWYANCVYLCLIIGKYNRKWNFRWRRIEKARNAIISNLSFGAKCAEQEKKVDVVCYIRGMSKYGLPCSLWIICDDSDRSEIHYIKTMQIRFDRLPVFSKVVRYMTHDYHIKWIVYKCRKLMRI